MKITNARIVGVGLVTVVLAGVAFMLRPKPLVVDTTTVTRHGLEATVDADGRTRVRQRYMVVAPVAGRVERITRVEGAAVRAGDVVARLTSLPLDSQAVAQARARVEAASALALEANAQVRVATAELEQRRRELSRAQRLAEVGGVAPRVVEECELGRLQAEEAVRGATERVRAAEADARQAHAVLAGLEPGSAMTMLVRAPASGRVLRVAERSERIVAAGTPLLEIGDPASLEVVVDVLSSDAALIHTSDPVRLMEWGGADGGEHMNALAGRVREIEPAGFTKVSALGVEEQRVNVIVDVDSVPAGVGDGFRVDASIVVWSAPDVIVVPRSALVRTHGTGVEAPGWTAFVVRAGRVESRAVHVGHFGGVSAEVLAGVEPGDAVVVFPSDQVKAGVRARAQKGS
jgi:HlyD family secretion protein